MPSDEELMAAVGRGDSASLEQLVVRYQRLVWHVAWRFLGDAAEAEDIAQETFLRLLGAAGRYRPTAKFPTYLYRIVTRLCLDGLRKKRPVLPGKLPDGAAGGPSPAAAAEARERQAAVRAAVARLGARQRMAVVLRYYEELSCRDVAAAMGVTPKAVERLLARAREALQASLAGPVDPPRSPEESRP
jgi:RNA polymerase sigma-70 factor (ECF subfamily)